MKITEYQKVTSLAPNDIMLIDGAGGTRTIEPKDAIAPQLNDLKDEIGDDLSDLDEAKANVNGYYSMMTTGRAENLLDTRATGVARNFVFDTTAGTDSVEDTGTAEIKSIHGNTIVWNQLYSAEKLTGSTYATYEVGTNGVVTVKSASDDTIGKTIKIVSPIAGHKYYVSSELADVDTNNTIYVGILKSNGTADGRVPSEGYSGTDWSKSSGILTASNEAIEIAFRINDAAAANTSAKFRNIVVCDLTKMFGAGNEPATAADFEALFPRTDYAYDAGSLLNFTGTGIKTVGFNLLGRTPIIFRNSSAPLRPLDRTTFAHLKAGITYRYRVNSNTATGRWVFSIYGEDGHDLENAEIDFGIASNRPTKLSTTGSFMQGNDMYFTYGTFTPLVDCYMAIDLRLKTGSADFPDPIGLAVHAVWSGYRNDEYEEYWTRTLDLPVSTYFPDGMRSTSVYFDELTANKAIKRITEFDLGSMIWSKNAGKNQYYSTLPTGTPSLISDSSAGTAIRCSAYPSGNAYNITSAKAISNSAGVIWIVDPDISTTAEMKTALTGVKAYAALAEPVETDITVPLNLTYQVDDFGTEELLPENDDEPSTSPFSGVVAYSTDFTRQVSNMPKNYTSQSTLDELLEAIGTAVGGTFTKTWDSTNGKWTFTFEEDAAE